jgi:hypothetical protein
MDGAQARERLHWKEPSHDKRMLHYVRRLPVQAMACMSTYRHERIHMGCRNAREQSVSDAKRLRGVLAQVKARMETHRVLADQLDYLLTVDQQELLDLTESLGLELRSS